MDGFLPILVRNCAKSTLHALYRMVLPLTSTECSPIYSNGTSLQFLTNVKWFKCRLIVLLTNIWCHALKFGSSPTCFPGNDAASTISRRLWLASIGNNLYGAYHWLLRVNMHTCVGKVTLLGDKQYTFIELNPFDIVCRSQITCKQFISNLIIIYVDIN